jgi:hypothetical protein
LQEKIRMFNQDGIGKDFHFTIDPWVCTFFSDDTIPPKGKDIRIFNLLKEVCQLEIFTVASFIKISLL